MVSRTCIGTWATTCASLCRGIATKAALALVAVGAISATSLAQTPGPVVISQVYGGGNVTASVSKYTDDYVELFNRSCVPVDVSTWSLQYASSAGTSWAKAYLPAGTVIQPGQYYLVQFTRKTSGAAVTGAVALPVLPDAYAQSSATGASSIDMGGTSGKLALVRSRTTVSAVACPNTVFTNGVVDMVTWGTGGSACEGTVIPTLANNGLALVRNLAGCTDTNVTSADFVAQDANIVGPRNSATALNSCGMTTGFGSCQVASTGLCFIVNSADCTTLGGTYADCTACPARGACCTGDGTVCSIKFPAECTLATGTFGGPNSTCYTVTTGSALEAIGTPTAGITGDDSANAVITLPFTFKYWGVDQTQIWYNTNGLAGFGATTSTTAAKLRAPHDTTPNNILYALWGDLNVDSANASTSYGTNGSAPNRVFLITWTNPLSYYPNSAGLGTFRQTFQVAIFESSNAIEFRYGSTSPEPWGGYYETGFEDSTGNNGQWRLGRALTANTSFRYSPICAPTGACCRADNTCTVGNQGACAGVGLYQGNGTVCGGTCPASVGSCCVGTACSVTDSTACSGSFTGGGTCTTNLCAFPCCSTTTGACSLVATGSACTGVSGAAGAACGTIVCASGSCCNTATYTCSVTGPAGCLTPNIYTASSTCTLTPCPAPANDLCANAAIIPGSGPFPYSVQGSNVTATDTAAFTPAICASSSRDVWFSFTPTASAAYSLTLCNAFTGTLDTVMSVHSACPITGNANLDASLAPNNCNDDGCSGSAGPSAIGGLMLNAGQTYLIRVARWSTGTGGQFQLDITTEPFGACCDSASVCTLKTQSACQAISGSTFTTGGTLCSTSGICNGACCVTTTGVCTYTAAASCTGNHGGVGSTCTATFCPTTTCCNDSTGACTINGTAACPTGTTANAAATCTPTPCPASTCCNDATGACTVTGTVACPSGSTAFPNPTCSPSPCPTTTCCNTTSGACTLTGTAACPSGTVANAATTCSPTNPCPIPPGQACTSPIVLSLGVPTAGDLTNSVLTSAISCSSGVKGLWYSFTAPAAGSYLFDHTLVTGTGNPSLGLFSTCGTEIACVNPCTGTNAQSTQAMTAGQTIVFRAGGCGDVQLTWNVTVSVIVSGACCNASTGACSVGLSSACPSPNFFLGANSTCPGASCPVVAACCNNTSGVCTLIYGATCPSGTTTAAGLVCDVSTCPVTAICCNNSTGACTSVYGGSACPSGTTTGSGTVCGTCPVSAVCCNDTTGACTTIYGGSCPSGTHAGTGTVCDVNTCPAQGTCCNPVTAACFLNYSGACSAPYTFNASASCSPNPCTAAAHTCENFDGGASLPSGWSSTTTGAGAVWAISTTQSNSPTNAAFTDDQASVSSQFLVMPAITAGGNLTLDFWSYYTTESTFDGWVVEYSTDSGATWTDVGNAGWALNGYNVAAISTGFSSPIAGRPAFSGAGATWTEHLATIPATAGQSVIIRFQMASDTSVSSTGVWIDDVCVAGAQAPGVCCRGSTCSTAFADAAACAAAMDTVAPLTVLSKFVTGSATCNTPVTVPGTLGNILSPCCYANYNHNSQLEVQDIFDFLNDWFAGKKGAIVGGDGTTGTLAVQNIFDFLNSWFAGGCN